MAPHLRGLGKRGVNTRPSTYPQGDASISVQGSSDTSPTLLQGSSVLCFQGPAHEGARPHPFKAEQFCCCTLVNPAELLHFLRYKFAGFTE